MARILSRLLVRVAILAASLAWAGFVVTQTVGDPNRGERIASAVLADDDARAEVSSPITSAVMSATGLPPEQRPQVAAEVDRLLQDPDGAQAFVDPFAGSWARMLGEDDPRPAELDLVRLLGSAGAALPAGTASTIELADSLPVRGVPLPRARLDWMGSLRDAVAVSLLPLAFVALAAFALAFAIGDRARVLRRIGVWAVAAGLTWVVIPPLVVWAARRWAAGADSVVAVSLDEATRGLLPVAVALAVLGAVALASSIAVASAGTGAPRSARPIDRRTRHPSSPTPDRRTPERRTPATPPQTDPSGHTAEMPVTSVQRLPDEDQADRTAEMPAVARTRPGAAVDAQVAGERFDDVAEADRDALWDYYYGSS